MATKEPDRASIAETMKRDPSWLIEKAIALGATGVRLIPALIIPIEEAIVEMCRTGRCEGYGKSANCPPHVIRPTQARKRIGRHRQGLLFKIDLAPELLVGKQRFDHFKKVYEIASELESSALRAGHPSSMGLGAGSCKPVFCRGRPCAALKQEGSCIHPSLARPSMEALGINVFALVRRVGWCIHTFRRDSDPTDVPSAMLVGLVLLS